MLYRTRFRLAIVVLGACLVGGGLYSQKRLAALTAEKTEVSQLAELKIDNLQMEVKKTKERMLELEKKAHQAAVEAPTPGQR